MVKVAFSSLLIPISTIRSVQLDNNVH
jgi:hypothetical protein